MLLKRRSPVIKKISHYLTGGVVLLKGVEKSAHFDHHPFVPILLFAIGFFIIIANIFHHWFEKKVTVFDTLFYTLEGCALLIVSYYYYVSGKKLLPFAFLVCSIAYFVAAYIFYTKKNKSFSTEKPGTFSKS